MEGDGIWLHFAGYSFQDWRLVSGAQQYQISDWPEECETVAIIYSVVLSKTLFTLLRLILYMFRAFYR